MTPVTGHAAIVELLGWAVGAEAPVRLRSAEGQEVVGVPLALDTHVTAHEVVLRPVGDEATELVVALARVVSAELL
ncbi:MAG: hypothetical protein NW201_04355 [Gemmatimonadales bacterium]|nr:hypothetical protein [Gemmatimonadales bacterium]